jgi:F1F0 ATPase subunit 2
MMNETLTLVLASVAGVLLGALFFGGLWWTVQKGLSSKRSALWFLGSLLLRMSIRITRATEKPACLAQEAGHAP